MKKRFTAALLTACLLLTLAPGAFAGEAPLTRGQVQDILVEAAADYNPAVTPETVLKGYANGDLGLDKPVTRAQALVMLSRAFGDLPAPVGHNARMACPSGNYTDVPAWAAEELNNIFDAGIVAGTSPTTFSPNRPITQSALTLFLQRVYALEGSNVKDDFYAAVNKDWLASAQITAGSLTASPFSEAGDRVQEQVKALIQEAVASDAAPGTPQAQIQALYTTYLDWDSRSAQGAEPLRPYLEAISGAASLEDLMGVHRRITRELCCYTLYGFSPQADFRDSDRYILVLQTLSSALQKEEYQNAAITAAARDYYARLLTLAGEPAQAARDQAEAYMALQQRLSQASLNIQDYYDISKTANLYTLEELEALLPAAQVRQELEAAGFTGSAEFQVQDVGLLNVLADLLKEGDLALLKSAMKLDLLISFAGVLSQDLADAGDALNTARYGATEKTAPEEDAVTVVSAILSNALGQIYVERYFSPQAKADAEDMVGEIRDVFRQRIQTLSWMTPATKAKAVEKLDAITVKAGYPDHWNAYLDQAELKSAAQGGSYFTNALALNQAAMEELQRRWKAGVDRSIWDLPVYTVNAFYDPSSNSICLPAGILQAPFYDVKADRTENLGGIGAVIAHEITHAFDNGGAQYDSRGNAASWWTPSDYTAFQALCQEVAAYYDGVEFAPGLACSGAQTISENIADLGAIACITQLEGQEAAPDYDTLYRSFAALWQLTGSREALNYLRQRDVHAPSKLRANRVLQSVPEFYSVYGIQPGDGMWLEETARVQVW